MVKHVSFGIYEGMWWCGENYIGETERNLKTLRNEHRNTKPLSEPAKHLLNNENHDFTWTILSSGHAKFLIKRKIAEAFDIAKFQPRLNECLQSKKL